MKLEAKATPAMNPLSSFEEAHLKQTKMLYMGYITGKIQKYH